MSYAEAKARYAAIGVDTEAAIARLKTVPISLHCWQGDDVRGFDTDPTKPLTSSPCQQCREMGTVFNRAMAASVSTPMAA